MLQNLRISNYALIRDIEISFARGFTVITGETGAGKSILIGALGLVLGNRAEGEALLDKEKKCVVEATFSLEGYNLTAFFEQNELDYDIQCILRREITPAGKSRAFINDSPCSLDLIRDLASRLIEIHSQHASLSLFRPAVQLGILDAWAGIQSDVSRYSELFQRYRVAVQELQDLEAKQAALQSDRQYLQFQHDELAMAVIRPGEKEKLEQDLEMLEHVEDIGRELAVLSAIFGEGGEGGLDSMLHAVSVAVGKLASLSGRYNDLAAQFRASREGIHALQAIVERESSTLDADPLKLSELRERLDFIQRLEHKHGLEGDAALLELMQRLATELNRIEHIDDQLIASKKDLDLIEALVRSDAKRLSVLRHDSAIALNKAVLDSLAGLNMKDAYFAVELESDGIPGIHGIDRVRFMFSANGEQLRAELSRIASGGELSRVMLALRANISERRLLPSIIFDEIDNGISGDTAAKVGQMMRVLGSRMQVITITHQPSIAGYGMKHLLVSKQEVEGFPSTGIAELTQNERVEVLAQMLSGGRLTEASRMAARELLAD
jgi:DNA repair protein RecN (Recombination protein N)